MPEDRWSVIELEHSKRSEPGRSVTYSAGVLSRIDEFDAEFFGISPREAAWIDPQQRILLEMSWEAMENAGVLPSSLSGTNCAVFVGISSLDYGTRMLDDLASLSSHTMTGNTLSIAANRLSYVFNLHGPSVAMDTACSSSLVALHHACRTLQIGEASTALVGGVNLLLHPYPFIGFSQASMLSADGRSKAFDARSDGYVRAEGGAVLLLKPLKHALKDGDDVQAIILATGINSDGARKTGMTIPSRDGQAELMRNVLARTNLSHMDIDFIEAHGTGTMVGDPIEAAAVGAVYGGERRKPLPIGSVKGNLGHMEAASGMGGLVKAVLALQKRALPPQLHLEAPNPNIDFIGLGLRPVTEYMRLEKKGPLIAGVNSFGFGGTNAHVLLKEYSQLASETALHAPDLFPPLFLSARSDVSLRKLAALYYEKLKNIPPSDYYDIAYAAAHRRDHLSKRLVLHSKKSDELAEKLAAYAKGGTPDGIILEEQSPQSHGIAFIYSGNGAQWVGMGLCLIAQSPEFAHSLAQIDARMQPIAGFSLLAELQADGEASRIADTVVAQPLLFAIQVAITRLLKAQGIEPMAVAGHSVGEVAAAWACGALDLDAAIRLIVARSRAQDETRGTGRMAAVGLSLEAMHDVMAEMGCAEDIAIAGVNSPNSLTIAGSLADLERIQSHLEPKGVFFRILDLEYAFHSCQMDPIQEPLLASLAGLQAGTAQGPAFVSTVTGGVLDGDQLVSEYWWRNVREPVQFSDAISALNGLGCSSFIEIGPNAILQGYIRECLASIGSKGRVLPTLRKGADGWNHFVETALRAHLLAEKPDLCSYFPRPGRHVRLPNYPWDRERHWHPRTSEGLMSFERRRVHPLLGWKIAEAEHVWENTVDPVVLPWLKDHKVGGAIVFPGSAYAEMALAAAREWLSSERLALEEMDIISPMVFDGDSARTLRFDLNDRDGSFQIKSRQRLSDDDWTLHAAGRLLQLDGGSSRAQLSPPSCGADRIDRKTHYRIAAKLGLDYGPTFQGLGEAFISDNFLEAELEQPADLAQVDYLIHPALLDVCFQSLVNFFRTDIDAGRNVAFLPVKTGRLECHRAGKPSRFIARLTRRSARSLVADFELFDAEDKLMASVSECRFRAASLAHKAQERPHHWRIDARLCPHPAEGLATQLPSTRELAKTLRLIMAEQVEPRSRWFQEGVPLFEALCVYFAFEAFSKIARENDDALQGLMTNLDPYTRWLTSILKQEGLLLERAGRWQLTDDTNLPAAQEIWLTLQREHGEALPSLVLLGRVGRHLQHLLQHPSERDAFFESLRTSPFAGALYQHDPAYAGISQSIVHLLRHLASDWPVQRRLRVLEIADGPSEVPGSLLAALPEDRLDYVLALPATEAERQQAQYAHERNLVIATLDPANWQLTAETRLPGKFDIVILQHTLHRAMTPRAVLNNVRRWLAADGCLVVAERHPERSLDFFAGLAKSWWHEATVDGAPHSSLANATAWADLLRDEGFEDVLDYSEPAAKGHSLGAYLLLARAPAKWEEALPLPEPASWLLLTDAASLGLAGQLSARMKALGQQVVSAQNLPQSLNNIDHVVDLRGWCDTPETAAKMLASALGNVKALAGHPTKVPRLWFVTRGGALASTLPGEVEANPQQAALWGFARVVMNEYPSLACTLIDLDCLDGCERLQNELLYPDGASEIVLSNTGRYVTVMLEANTDQNRSAEPGEHFGLDFHVPGRLNNLVWLPQDKAALDDGDIEVEVQAAGLNFRDVMYLMGLLPDEALEKGFAGASLGLEFSGIVSRVGACVRDFEPGDKVMGFGSACFASHVVTRADAVALMPKEWSYASAATVPTVFLTVFYALKQLADVQAGERVLIHGGAGGVGIAAIQLAKYMGAEVFATAGSDEKRDFVHLLGADHVFDSRSLAFADDILSATNGEGVDVVLNSLAGEAIRRNLSILKPFGRFLELGKRDFFENTPIGLRPFKDNISYFGIDADQLLTGRPELAQRLFREVMALFREGVLSPLPCQVFPAERVVEGFRTMQQARHIGKVVISLADKLPFIQQPATAPAPLQVSKDTTWIVAGGLSGFGLASAGWLAEHGVSDLILVGRRGLDTPGAKEAVEDFTSKGIRVQALACDIGNPAAVERMIQQVRKTCPPIKGVLHAAAVYDDALLQNLDATRMENVIVPKLIGAWNLHKATLDIPLEHFVVYSSIATAIGNPGQANYVAANAGLEALARMRWGMGLPAVCIGWGPIGDTGYLSRNEAVRDGLSQSLGKPPMDAVDALNELEHLLSQEHTVTVANFDWNKLARQLPSFDQERFSVLNQSIKNDGVPGLEDDIRTLIVGKSIEEVTEIVQQLVITEVAQVLSIGVDRIDPARSLYDFGLDSLMTIELAMGLEQRFGIQLPVMMLSESPAAEKVTQLIVERLCGGSDQVNANADADVDQVQRISQQHGESLEAEDIQQIIAGVQRLQDQGGGLTE